MLAWINRIGSSLLFGYMFTLLHKGLCRGEKRFLAWYFLCKTGKKSPDFFGLFCPRFLSPCKTEKNGLIPPFSGNTVCQNTPKYQFFTVKNTKRRLSFTQQTSFPHTGHNGLPDTGPDHYFRRNNHNPFAQASKRKTI